MTQTRLVSFAGATVAVEYDPGRPARIVDFLFRDFPAAPAGPVRATYRLLAGEVDSLRLYKDGVLLHESPAESTLADLLLSQACHSLAAHSLAGLLFHAAGLARGERGLLLPGTMGAGKSTLAAWLLARGWFYLSDELVYLPHGPEVMLSLPRPLNLKPPSRPVLRPWFDYEAQAGRFYSTPGTDLVPPELFNPATRPGRPPLGLVIFPDYRAGATFELRRLPKARAGLELMRCLVNARNLPNHGFDEIALLARTVPAYKLTYSHFEQIGDQIETLLNGRKKIFRQ